MSSQFLNEYTEKISLEVIACSKSFFQLANYIKNFKSKDRLFIFGNGGSSSIASHVATDFIKFLKINAICMTDHNLITCFANDYGFENWILEFLKSKKISKKDSVILISSSGESMNMINAANYLQSKKIPLITLTGFSIDNSLKKMGSINIHIRSKNYNIVEMSHHIILVSLVDHLKKNKF